MNYLSIYKSIIRQGKSEYKIRKFNKHNKLEYYENHHIIPKCIMLIRKPWLNIKSRSKFNLINKPWNMVLLTAREHFLCHRLLLKIKGNKIYHQTLCYAFLAFSRNRGNNRKLTMYQYNIIRKEISKLNSIVKTGFKHSKKSKLKMSISRKGVPKSEEHKKKIGISNKGKSLTHEQRLKIGASRDYTKSRKIKRKFNLCSIKKPSKKEIIDKQIKSRNLNWKIYFSDGKIIEIFNLNKWCKLNNYNRSCLSMLSKGKIKYSKNIIKVCKL